MSKLFGALVLLKLKKADQLQETGIQLVIFFVTHR